MRREKPRIVSRKNRVLRTLLYGGIMNALTKLAPTAGAEANSGDLLIIIHGEGRGRPIWVMDAMLGHTRSVRPDIAARLRVHRTGAPPPSLDSVAVILFYLADPLAAFFPDCYAEARALADEATARGIRVLNDPDALSRTQKSRQTNLWRAAGIRCADSHAFGSAEELRALIDRLVWPQILRDDAHHAQTSCIVCHSREEALAALPRMTYPGVALDFIDTRDAAGGKRDPLYARYFHKKRSFVFGPVVRNNHVFFSESPIVGQSSSTFIAETHWKRRALRAIGVRNQELDQALAEDFNYFAAAPEAREQMIHATQVLGLSMAALDYSVAADGSIVFWEANPYFSLPTLTSQKLLPKERRWSERIDTFYDAFVEWMAYELRCEAGHGVG